jgi:hypothetical protein
VPPSEGFNGFGNGLYNSERAGLEPLYRPSQDKVILDGGLAQRTQGSPCAIFKRDESPVHNPSPSLSPPPSHCSSKSPHHSRSCKVSKSILSHQKCRKIITDKVTPIKALARTLAAITIVLAITAPEPRTATPITTRIATEAITTPTAMAAPITTVGAERAPILLREVLLKVEGREANKRHHNLLQMMHSVNSTSQRVITMCLRILP